LLRLCDSGYANAPLCYVIGNSPVLFVVYLTCVLHSVWSCGDAIGYACYVFRPSGVLAAILRPAARRFSHSLVSEPGISLSGASQQYGYWQMCNRVCALCGGACVCAHVHC
jgi:hypothetical protein